MKSTVIKLSWGITIALTGLLLYFLLVGFELNAKSINQHIESALSESLGRNVVVDGPSSFIIKARPTVVLHGLHIANPSGFVSDEAPYLFSIEEAKLSLNLWGLLVGKIIIDNISGEGLTLSLNVNANGENNWTFKQTDEETDSLVLILNLLERADFKNITLSNLKVSFKQAGNKTYFFDLQELQAHLSVHDDVRITLKGTIEKTLPYHVNFHGSNLNSLVQIVQVQQLIDQADALTNQGWPFKLNLTFLNSNLQLDGNLNTQQTEVKLKLNTPDIRKFGRLLNLNLPNAGNTFLETNISVSKKDVRLSRLNAILGKSKLNGNLWLDYRAVPLIHGEISLPILDLEPFLKTANVASKENIETARPSTTHLLDLYKQLLAKDIDLSSLKLFEADLKVKIQTVQGFPGNISDANAQLIVKNGQLKIPMHLNLARVNLNGQLEATEDRLGSALRFKLWTKDEDIGELADFLFGLKGIKGQLGKLTLAIQAKGKNVHEALEHLKVDMQINKSSLSYGNTEGGKSIDFEIDRFVALIPPSRPLVIDFSGKLLKQALNIKLTGNAINEITKNEKGKFTFNAESKNTKIHASSEYSLNTENPTLNLEFSIDSPDIREIETWLGIPGAPGLPFSLSGSLFSNQNEIQLNNLLINLARSSLEIRGKQSFSNKKSLLSLEIESELLDLKELLSIFPEKKVVQTHEESRKFSAFNLNVPILPKNLDLSDTDLKLWVKQTHGTVLPLKDIKMNARIRDGQMNHSPFSARIDEVIYEGAVLLDARSKVPSIKFWLNANKVNIGQMLKKINIANNIDATFGNINFYLESHASILSEFIARAKLIAVLRDGNLKIQYPNTKSSSSIMIQNGVLETLPNKNSTLKMSGLVNQSPIEINLITSATKDFILPNKPIPIQLSVQAANSSINLSGNLSRIAENPTIYLNLAMQGQRLTDLNQLLDTNLPPWGPWELNGMFNMDKNRYSIEDLNLKVGESHLRGKGKLTTNAVPALMEVFLNAETIQLNDFSTRQWSTPPLDKKNKSETRSIGQQLENLLTPEILNKSNLNLEVAVKQVISGRDRLGKGMFNLRLENGEALIGPAAIETEGGKAFWSLKYHPRPNDIQMKLNVDIRHFDYGVIARRVNPNADIKGQLSLNLNIDSSAPHIGDLMAYGNGHLNVMVWPENQKSGVLDLWAVNLLSGLLPAIDPSHQSKINCAIGKFQLKNGILKEKQLQIDTTKMRVTGTLLADFKSEEIYTQLRPQAKEVQFLSLSTPVNVTGTFKNFNIGLSVGDIAETIVRLGTSVFWVPLKKLFSEKMVSDGSDICLSAE